MNGVPPSILSGRPRRALLATALAALVSLVAAAPGATAAQFRPAPWATINACDPPQAPGSVGVRVSVPNRANAAQWMRIRIQFFDGTRGAWSLVRRGGDAGFVRLSDGGGRVFGGTTFTFSPPTAGNQVKLRGIVTVEWRRGRRVVSKAQILTHANHRSTVDPLFAVSQATCVIAR